MNDMPAERGQPADFPVSPAAVPEVEIGAGHDAGAPPASELPDFAKEVDTTSIGVGDVADALPLFDSSAGDELERLHAELAAARTAGPTAVEAASASAATAAVAEVDEAHQPTDDQPQPEQHETEPQVAAQLHDAMRDAALVSTGSLPNSTADVAREQELAPPQIPPTPKAILDTVPVPDGADSVRYTQRVEVSNGLSAQNGQYTDTQWTEVAFSRYAQTADGQPQAVVVRYTTSQCRPQPDTPGGEPAVQHTGRRDVITEPRSDHGESAGALPIDHAVSATESAEIAGHLQETTRPPEVNDTNPATEGDMRVFFEQVRDTSAYIVPGPDGNRDTHTDTHAEAIDEQSVPPHALQAFESAHPAYAGTDATYVRVAEYAGHGDNGSQAAVVGFERHEHHQGEVVRTVEVQYVATVVRPLRAEGTAATEYAMFRITRDITPGAPAASPVAGLNFTERAMGGYGLQRQPTDAILSRAEAQEITNHVRANPPMQRVFSPESEQ